MPIRSASISETTSPDLLGHVIQPFLLPRNLTGGGADTLCPCLKFNWNIGGFLEVPKTDAILVLFFIFLLFGCGDSDTSDTTPSTPAGMPGDVPAFPYDPRLNHTNLEIALNAAASNPDFPDVSVTLRPTFPSINIPGSAKADISLTIPEETCRPLDSTSHAVMNGLPKRSLPPSSFRRHNMRRWTLFNADDSDFAFANVTATWHNERPGKEDLVAGYWICSNGNSLKIGSFVEGPELLMSPNIPEKGQAIYTGYMSGMHTYYYGPNWLGVTQGRITEGVKEVGEFIAPMVLVADFDKGTLRGCVACVENLETSGFGVDAQGQYFYPPDGLYTDLSFNSSSFEPVRITEAGIFQGTDFKFRLNNPARGFDLPSTGSSGAWQGKFSGLSAEDGNPRGITGSIQGVLNYEDGSNSRYIATFIVSNVLTGF